MAVLQDKEFGDIKLRRSAFARQVRLRLDAGGGISISLPKRAPIYIAKQLLEESRQSLRQNLQSIQSQKKLYEQGDIIGKTHRLRIEACDVAEPSFKLKNLEVVASLPFDMLATSAAAQTIIHKGIEKALRIQAKAYLPRRLGQLGETFGYRYDHVRYSSAGTRWGSCSSAGTISLNIWLMQLPFELIDYVLVHELCHTKNMNHSDQFWRAVEQCDPAYKAHRKTLKTFHPYA